MSKIDWKVGDIGTTYCYGMELRIFAVDDDWLAVADEHTRFWVHSSQFFPIKTKEQIEAEEREEFAHRLVEEMGKSPTGYPNAMNQARKIYDLGYRKQGEGK